MHAAETILSATYLNCSPLIGSCVYVIASAAAMCASMIHQSLTVLSFVNLQSGQAACCPPGPGTNIWCASAFHSATDCH